MGPEDLDFLTATGPSLKHGREAAQPTVIPKEVELSFSMGKVILYRWAHGESQLVVPTTLRVRVMRLARATWIPKRL